MFTPLDEQGKEYITDTEFQYLKRLENNEENLEIELHDNEYKLSQPF